MRPQLERPGQGLREGVPRGDPAFPFGGAPSHCLEHCSASPAPGSASSPALQETMGKARDPVCWTQVCRDMRSERACPSTSTPDPDDDPDSRGGRVPGQAGSFGSGQVPPASRSTSGPALASGRPEDPFHSEEPSGVGVGGLDVSGSS